MTCTAIGIDCGFQHIGVAVIQGTVLQPTMIFGDAILTKPQHHKDLRRSEDDVRRLNEMQDRVAAVVERLKPHVAGLESYAPFVSQSKYAWRTSMCFGLLWAVCRAARVRVYTQLPIDVKLAVCGQRTASKEDVIDAIRKNVASVDAYLLKFPSGRHEHICDAAGHAMVAMRGYENGRPVHG